MADEINQFDPVLCSTADNEFLLAQLGKPTIVAMRALQFPVTPATVRPILDRANELEELRKADKLEWVGYDAMKAAIVVWLNQNAKWADDHKRSRNAPRFPSLYSYDGKGRPHRGGPGSDSGRVRTYFAPNGDRIPFAIDLIPDQRREWAAPGFTEQSANEKLLKVDSSTNRIECLVPVGDHVCGHTESFKPDSRASQNAARARMSKHLRKSTIEVEAHRELHTLEFGT